ncbi:MAG: hypothetical protein R3Y53_06425 [Bacillota bacterium]
MAKKKKDYKNLLGLFTEPFYTITTSMEKGSHKTIYKTAPLLFQKWCYTSLLTDSSLTPTNIVNDIENDDTKEYAFVMKANPSPRKKYAITLESYSTKKHPFVKDLALLVEAFTPSQNTKNTYFLMEEEVEELKKSLSQTTDFYVEYLTAIAWQLDLLEVFPSIHTSMATASKNAEYFFKHTTEEMLRKCGVAGCALAANRFFTHMDLEVGTINRDFFLKYLQSSFSVEQIFVDFYQLLDFDISKLWELSPDELDEEEQMVASSFLFTGILLDEWFVFPMTNFLHFLRPISFIAIDFLISVNYLANTVILGRELDLEIFSPPSYLELTVVAKTLFGGKNSEEQPFESLPFFDYEEFYQDIKDTQIYYNDPFIDLPLFQSDIFRFAIYREDEIEEKKILEVDTTMLADEFCQDVCNAFYEFDVDAYTLELLDENAFPMIFAPSYTKKSINFIDEKQLVELPFSLKNPHLTLSPKEVGVVPPLKLELVAVKTSAVNRLYPRISE